MEKKMTISIALALFASTAASAATTTETPVAPTEAMPPQISEKKEKPKKICRDNVATTGSRITRRVCKTEEEWAEKEDGQEVGIKSKGGLDPDPLAKDIGGTRPN
jgi:hypothetical protein